MIWSPRFVLEKKGNYPDSHPKGKKRKRTKKEQLTKPCPKKYPSFFPKRYRGSFLTVSVFGEILSTVAWEEGKTILIQPGGLKLGNDSVKDILGDYDAKTCGSGNSVTEI